MTQDITQYNIAQYVEGIRSGERSWIGQAITLVESSLPADQEVAAQLLDELMPHTGGAYRVGITGVPGAGKSTLINVLGLLLIEKGHKVGVLAVDPSSPISGGSIMGDKTRMSSLSQSEHAFVRPSPTHGKLGGATRATREVLLILEAAGFDAVFVETVGVGQSESVVADMVDFFLLVLIPGAGDELQGIKRGVVEMADHIVVNKADGDNAERARRAVSYYRSALQLLTSQHQNWKPSVGACSALERTGLDELWEVVKLHRVALEETGELVEKRREQQVSWMWAMLEDRLLSSLRQDDKVAKMLGDVVGQVSQGVLSPPKAASMLLGAFTGKDLQ